jgi:hypothetical protein
MIVAAWSTHDGRPCIRVAAARAGARIDVRPAGAADLGAGPAMAGSLVPDGRDWCFLPRFPFLDGTTYTVHVDGERTDLARRSDRRTGPTEVVAIYPTSTQVPRNLLRFHLWFSAPMSTGGSAPVRLEAADGSELVAATMPTEYELWDSSHRRLTVLLDPARIKRGLVGQREIGYSLQPGSEFRLVVADGFRDAVGRPVRSGTARRYEVGGDERRPVIPSDWSLGAPAAYAREPLVVGFDRPLDHALLGRCLHITDPTGRTVAGGAELGRHERSWRFTPRQAWAAGPHRLVVDAALEDLAGNSVGRLFDRDLRRPQDDPSGSGPVPLAFSVHRSCSSGAAASRLPEGVR